MSDPTDTVALPADGNTAAEESSPPQHVALPSSSSAPSQDGDAIAVPESTTDEHAPQEVVEAEQPLSVGKTEPAVADGDANQATPDDSHNTSSESQFVEVVIADPATAADSALQTSSDKCVSKDATAASSSAAASASLAAAGASKNTKYLQPVSDREFYLILSSLLAGLFLASLDSTIVSTALPTIVRDLSGSHYVSWIVSSYLMASTAIVPLSGKLSDVFGRRPIFLLSEFFFFAGSLGCAVSANIFELIGFRAVQGIGAGGLLSLTQVILADLLSPRDRGRYSGFLGATFAFSSVVGPLIGGFFTDYAGDGGWRWCFYINLPVTFIAFVITMRYLKIVKPRVPHVIDVLGAVLITAFVVLLLLPLTWGGDDYAWSDPIIIGLFCGAGVTFVLFFVNEYYAREPIVPLHLFKNRTFSVAGLVSCAVGVGLYSSMTYLPLYLQYVKHYSATSSGLLMSPLMLSLVIASIGSGAFMARTGKYAIFPMVGCFVSAVAGFTFTTLRADHAYVGLAFQMIFFGFGVGLSLQIVLVAVQNAVQMLEIAVATSAVSFFRTMFGAAGVVVFQTIMMQKFKSEIKERTGHEPSGGGTLDDLDKLSASQRAIVDESYAKAIAEGFWLVGPVLLLAFFTSLALPHVPLRMGPTHHAHKATNADGSSKDQPADEDTFHAAIAFD
jgi:EmrB/QacA subfamily drug resistance transporter